MGPQEAPDHTSSAVVTVRFLGTWDGDDESPRAQSSPVQEGERRGVLVAAQGPPPLLGLWLLSPPAPREPWARPRAQGRSSAVLARLGTEPCSKGAPRGQQKPRGALTGEEEPGGGTRWERPFSEKRAVGEWGPSGRL